MPTNDQRLKISKNTTMIRLEDVKILVISQSETDRDEIKAFMVRMPFDNIYERDFVVSKLVPTDDYHFAIFNAAKLPPIKSETVLNPENEAYLQLFREYLKKPIKYVLYYGEHLHDLDRERCPSANSKFTLFARIRELIEFMNSYKEDLTK